MDTAYSLSINCGRPLGLRKLVVWWHKVGSLRNYFWKKTRHLGSRRVSRPRLSLGWSSGVPQVHPSLPNQLPTLSTQEMEQIMELQRRISSEMTASEAAQIPLGFLSSFTSEVRRRE